MKLNKIALIGVFAFFILSCSTSSKKSEGLKNVDAMAFQSLMKEVENSTILDVRTIDEYEQGHIEGAQMADISSSAFQYVIAKLDKSKSVFVYCLSGGRSSQAADALASAGFTSIYNLDGGMLAWNMANLPVSTSAKAKLASLGMNMGDFEAKIKGKKRVIVDYNAEWCGPCKQLSPILKAWVKEQNGAVELLEIDVDANPELAKAKKIEAIPYLEMYKDGKMTWSNVGLIGKAELNQTK